MRGGERDAPGQWLALEHPRGACRGEADAPAVGTEVALRDQDGTLRGIMRVEEIFARETRREAREVYGTEEEAHPGVAAIYAQGPVSLVADQRVPFTSSWAQYLTPAQTRAPLPSGLATVVGFQTRNPVHRAHEYIQKCALEIVDGLLLHPLVGETKGDDIPADVRMQCYEVLLDNYYPHDRVILRAAGGDALRRAARGNLPRHHAQELRLHPLHRRSAITPASATTTAPTTRSDFDQFAPGEIGIVPLNSSTASTAQVLRAWPRRRPARIRPRSTSQLAAQRCASCCARASPPPEFSRPEVARILIEAMREGTGGR